MFGERSPDWVKTRQRRWELTMLVYSKEVETHQSRRELTDKGENSPKQGKTHQACLN